MSFPQEFSSGYSVCSARLLVFCAFFNLPFGLRFCEYCLEIGLEMFGSGMNLITTVIGFGMSATFIVFVCTRIICGRIRGVESRPMFETDSRIDLEQAEQRISGLEPVLVAAIPTMRFNREASSSIEDAQCSICLGEYQEKDVLRIMPKCGHNFHLCCIDTWLRKHSTCPVCRFPLQDSIEITKHVRQATFNMSQSIDAPNSSPTEHSRQWLLPGLERSLGSADNRGHLSSDVENSGSVELEIRH